MGSVRSRGLRLLPAVAIFAALAAMLRSAFPMEPGLDYFQDASDTVDALARGDLEGLLAGRPLMGSFSLVLRAPFVALLYGGSLDAVYYAGVLPCVAAVVALGLALRRRMLALGRPELAATLVAAIALLNPGVFRAIHWGHPEELLGGALCALAVFAAARDRWLGAAVLLGLAVCTKQWAVIAVVPVLLAAQHRRLPLALVAGAVALAFTLPSILAAPDTFVSQQRHVAQVGTASGPANVWWLIAEPRTAAEREAVVPGFAYEIPAWLAPLTHPMIVLAALPLGLLFWRRRAALQPEDALGLLALLMLLRCVLDPWNNDYYHAPFLLALLAWEATARGGWPRLTLFAGAALALTFPASAVTFTELSAGGGVLAVTYLAWSVPLAAWLFVTLLAPGIRHAAVAALRRRLPRPAVANVPAQ
jgi:hypothetical protein